MFPGGSMIIKLVNLDKYRSYFNDSSPFKFIDIYEKVSATLCTYHRETWYNLFFVPA